MSYASHFSPSLFFTYWSLHLCPLVACLLFLPLSSLPRFQVGNAVKFTNRGTVTVGVTQLQSHTDGFTHSFEPKPSGFEPLVSRRIDSVSDGETVETASATCPSKTERVHKHGGVVDGETVWSVFTVEDTGCVACLFVCVCVCVCTG